MPRQKKPTATTAENDRHKVPATTIRLDPGLKAALEGLARERCSSMTAQLVRGAVEMLTREGKWPPPAN